MIIELLKKLNDCGDLKTLMAAGVISPNVKTQFDIYNKYESLKQSQGGSVDDIVLQVADDFKVCQATVYKALKKMRQ